MFGFNIDHDEIFQAQNSGIPPIQNRVKTDSNGSDSDETVTITNTTHALQTDSNGNCVYIPFELLTFFPCVL